MSFARKMKRKKNNAQKMRGYIHKEGYDTETRELWINETNGKEKCIEKERAKNG